MLAHQKETKETKIVGFIGVRLCRAYGSERKKLVLFRLLSLQGLPVLVAVATVAGGDRGGRKLPAREGFRSYLLFKVFKTASLRQHKETKETKNVGLVGKTFVLLVTFCSKSLR